MSDSAPGGDEAWEKRVYEDTESTTDTTHDDGSTSRTVTTTHTSTPWLAKPMHGGWFSRGATIARVVAVMALLVIIGFGGSAGRAVGCGPPPPSSVTPNQLEAFSRLNAFRGPDLVATAELMNKAQNWSVKMADDGKLSHSDLGDGIAPGWRRLGENVAVANSLSSVQAALEASPSHRENMLNPAFSEGGVGVTARDGMYWVVQEFLDR